MVQVGGPAAEGILRVRRGEELLEVGQVIQLKAVREDGLDAKALAQLDETRLAGQAGRGRIGVESFN